MFIKLLKYATNNLLEFPESASLEILIITLCIFLIIYTLYALLMKNAYPHGYAFNDYSNSWYFLKYIFFTKSLNRM